MLEGVDLVVEAVLLRSGGNEALEEMIAADQAEVFRFRRARTSFIPRSKEATSAGSRATSASERRESLRLSQIALVLAVAERPRKSAMKSRTGRWLKP